MMTLSEAKAIYKTGGGSLLTFCILKPWESFNSTHLKKPPERQQRRPKP